MALSLLCNIQIIPSLAIDIQTNTVAKKATKNQCCCIGKPCECAKQANGSCRSESLQTNNTERATIKIIIKGIGCEDTDTHLALLLSAKHAYIKNNKTYLYIEKKENRIASYHFVNKAKQLSLLDKPPQAWA
eukprot:COSAG01_NODE_52_length_31456_cov_125.226648_34_plen_132_part_00